MEKGQRLLDEYPDQFRTLAENIKSLDTVRDVEDIIEVKARQRAIEMVEGWLGELFNFDIENFRNLTKEDDIYKHRD